MKFSDLTECPFCGCEEYYTKEYVCGVIRYNECLTAQKQIMTPCMMG